MTIEEFVKFIFLLLCFVVAFWLGHAATKAEYEERLQDKQIELNICTSSMDLFKEDFDAFCAERFEKMGC
jgi:hypothetical protein